MGNYPDRKMFDADKGNEAVLREMVSTVGSKGKASERARAIVSVNMLSEGWDVKSVTHILGLRASGSPLLAEQAIGRSLRRTNYDVLNQPLHERASASSNLSLRSVDFSDEQRFDFLASENEFMMLNDQPNHIEKKEAEFWRPLIASLRNLKLNRPFIEQRKTQLHLNLDKVH